MVRVAVEETLRLEQSQERDSEDLESLINDVFGQAMLYFPRRRTMHINCCSASLFMPEVSCDSSRVYAGKVCLLNTAQRRGM